MVTKKAFLDSNVLANWMLLDAAVQEVKSKGEKALKELRDKTARRYPSYLLLEELRKSGKRPSIRFGTSTFAIAETNHVILEEYVARRLYDRGIPFEFWETLRKGEQLSDEDEHDLIAQLSRFLGIFSNIRNPILRWFDPPDFVEVEVEITALRVSTTDAFLVSQAVEAGCDYFVTEDRALRKLLKRHRLIRPISAQAMLSKVKAREKS